MIASIASIGGGAPVDPGRTEAPVGEGFAALVVPQPIAAEPSPEPDKTLVAPAATDAVSDSADDIALDPADAALVALLSGQPFAPVPAVIVAKTSSAAPAPAPAAVPAALPLAPSVPAPMPTGPMQTLTGFDFDVILTPPEVAITPSMLPPQVPTPVPAPAAPAAAARLLPASSDPVAHAAAPATDGAPSAPVLLPAAVSPEAAPATTPPDAARVAQPEPPPPATPDSSRAGPAVGQLVSGIEAVPPAPAPAPAPASETASVSRSAAASPTVAHDRVILPIKRLREKPATARAGGDGAPLSADAPVATFGTTAASPFTIAPRLGDTAPAAVPLPAEIGQNQLDAARHAAWLDGLARDIAATAAPDAKLSFAVAPERLGDVRVDVHRTEAGAAVQLTAADPRASALLADARLQLQAEARAAGVRIAETTVGITGQSLAGGGGQPGGHQAYRRPSEPLVRTAGTPTMIPTTPARGSARAAAQDRYA